MKYNWIPLCTLIAIIVAIVVAANVTEGTLRKVIVLSCLTFVMLCYLSIIVIHSLHLDY